MSRKCDFSGWATKNNIRCSDGRIIRENAFAHQDGARVPLVFGHVHDNPSRVLGYCDLENRPEGVYCYGFFNGTSGAGDAREELEHGDITHLSIWAKNLREHGSDVLHGDIKEVSLVLAGANPGARIETFEFGHSDDSGDIIGDEAMIYTDEVLEVIHAEDEGDESEETDETGEGTEGDNDSTVEDVIKTMDDKQRKVLAYLLEQASQGDGETEDDGEAQHDDMGGNEMPWNVFDQSNNGVQSHELTHDDGLVLMEDARRCGSFRDAVLAHEDDFEQEYGIRNIEYLFPDDKALSMEPEFIKRPDEWVAKVWNAVKHVPFSRIKIFLADITEDEARAKGYIKGNRKKDEVFGLLKRRVGPTTIYKKQKLDHDDLVDIDFNVVPWLNKEMTDMLKEEICRAILVTDGRSDASEDKIDPLCLRPIWTDDDLFTIKRKLNIAANSTEDAIYRAFIKECVKARKDYRGSGNPVLLTTEDVLTGCMLIEDVNGRRIYDTEEKLRSAMRVSDIITVPVMENLSRIVGTETRHLMGLIVNLKDYSVGADKGGKIDSYEQFDIDFNQEKYLKETRASGMLTKPFSAIAIEAVYAVTMSMAAESGSETILGKEVSTLQSDIVVDDHSIKGTLHYVTGYTGYSGIARLQKGNFLALKFVSTADTVEVKLDPTDGAGGWTALDSDMNVVLRIKNKDNQNLLVRTTKGTDVVEYQYDLSGLVCESAN